LDTSHEVGYFPTLQNYSIFTKLGTDQLKILQTIKENTSLIVLRIFKLIFELIFTKQNVFWRKQTLFSGKKDGCQICVNNGLRQKKRKEKIFVFSANQEASSIRAYLTKQIYKQLHVSSRNVLQFTSEFTIYVQVNSQLNLLVQLQVFI